MEVTHRIGCVFTMSCSVSMQLYAMVIGSYISTHPMVFPYSIAASAAVLAITFLAATRLAASIRSSKHSMTN